MTVVGAPPGFDRFPEVPALIATYLSERAVDEELADAPPPWDIGALPEPLASVMLNWTDSVCRWLNTTYAWQPNHVIPPCWKEHQQLAYEVAALAFARDDAYVNAGTTVVWHEQYERFTTRMNVMLGRGADQCRVGRHDPRPSRFQLSVWHADG
ncbi:hypothetical protein [Streptomyces sp. NPDC048442]|uniref:hypothetical protein n=1 Tax=Streptomyces sp. NPDC048442 TaxID=3154823 RepID=UPI003415630F